MRNYDALKKYSAIIINSVSEIVAGRGTTTKQFLNDNAVISNLQN